MPAPTEVARPTRNVAPVSCVAKGGKQRRQGRDRAVHQPNEPRLHELQQEHAALDLGLRGARAARQEFLAELLRERLMPCLAAAGSPSSLRTSASVARFGARSCYWQVCSSRHPVTRQRSRPLASVLHARLG
jgi:hypothetical protein